MIAQELEVSLHMAFMEARQKRHEFITVEHLLLAMLDNPSAAEVLRACAANVEELRKLLTDFINEHTPVVSGEDVDTQPTLGFQRVIQRAILHVQSSGKKEVTGANVLVAIFGENDSHAASPQKSSAHRKPPLRKYSRIFSASASVKPRVPASEATSIGQLNNASSSGCTA